MRTFFFIFLVLLSLSAGHALANIPDSTLGLIPDPPADQARAYEQHASQDGAFGDYFRLRVAEKHLKAGNLNEAFRFVSRVHDPVFVFWKKVLLAEIYWAREQVRQSLALMGSLPPKPDYELFYGEGLYEQLFKRAVLIRLLAKKALNQNTREDTALIVTLFPDDKMLTDSLGEQAENSGLNTTDKITRLNTLSKKRMLKLIPGLVSAQEIEDAHLPLENKCTSLFALGNASRLSKDHWTESTAAYQAMIKLRCPSDLLASAYYRLGLAQPSHKKQGTGPDLREKYLTSLYKTLPDSRLADDAVYRLYKLSLSRKDTAQADKYYQILMHLKTGDMKSELAFELAYEQFKKQNFEKSASILSEALDTIPTADESYTKTLYWYARSLEKTTGRKNHDKAQSTYHRLITEFPYSFYAVLASHRVNSPITLPQRPIIIGEAPTENTTTFELIDAFNKKGFHQAARIVLDFALHEHPQWLLSHKEYLTLKLIESQNYRKALALASDHFKSGPYGPLTITDDPLFTAFYPLPFKSKTKIAYAKTNLPKGAIEGIMREESLFQRTVSSHAGAIGLMQLMPQTAAQVQKGLIEKGAPTTDFSSDLTDTKTNILLGATYLDQMITKFKNHLPLAIMAYNAGPGNVRKWLQRLGPLELDEFIENIPYTETQGYVKRVLRSMHVYGDLYNNTYFTKGEDINFTLPVIKPSPKKHKHHKVNKKKGKKQ